MAIYPLLKYLMILQWRIKESKKDGGKGGVFESVNTEIGHNGIHEPFTNLLLKNSSKNVK